MRPPTERVARKARAQDWGRDGLADGEEPDGSPGGVVSGVEGGARLGQCTTEATAHLPPPTSGRATAAGQQRGRPDGRARGRTETVRQCPDSSGRILGVENRDREWQRSLEEPRRRWRMFAR